MGRIVSQVLPLTRSVPMNQTPPATPNRPALSRRRQEIDDRDRRHGLAGEHQSDAVLFGEKLPMRIVVAARLAKHFERASVQIE